MAALLGTWLATAGRRHLLRFWNHTSTAFNLGVFRVVVLMQLYPFDFAVLAALPDLGAEGLTSPLGWRWLHPFLPPSADVISSAVALFRVLAVMGLLGLMTRFVLPLLTIVSFWMLLGPHFVGKITHYHHLWLALAILSLFPCGDALSLDALVRWWRGQPIAAHQRRLVYGRPLVFVWMMMGAIYFFPGLWKFVASGFAWALSDNVQLKILAKIYETGQQPALPLYQYPVLCQLGGVGTLILELGFPLAMLFPASRLLFAAGGWAFHEMTRSAMLISFTSLQWFYVTFIDWSRLLTRSTAAPIMERVPRWKTTVCALLVGGMWVAGVVAIDSWPWAVYPTFAPREETFVNSIEMRVFTPGTAAPLRVFLQEEPDMISSYGDRTRLRAYLTSVMVQRDPGTQAMMLNGLLAIWQKAHPGQTPERVEFWQIKVPLLPLGAPPEAYRQIGQV
jgi:hypothetical protein